MKNFLTGLGCLGIILLVVLLLCIEPFLVMLLWNWIAVSLFSAPVITFWHAVGICWLCNLLFGGVRYVASSN